MKGIQVFGIIAGCFALLIVIILLTTNRSYEWIPTFEDDSDEPFGCELFDRMVGQSLGNRYQVERKTLSLRELAKNEEGKPQGWLMVNYDLPLSANEVGMLLSMVRRGDHVMLCATRFGGFLNDSLDFAALGNPYRMDKKTMKVAMRPLDHKMPVGWTDCQGGYRRDTFAIHNVLTECTIISKRDSLPTTILAQNITENKPVAISFQIGKGQLTLVTMPLLFTNYGMLDGRGSELIFRLLSTFGEMTVHRTVLRTQKQTREEDFLAILGYIESQPPLWWAWCLSILLVMLFMLTNARRRQRVIPVMTPPQNHSLEFVRLIGTLYAHQEGHADLVQKKFRYTAEHLRCELHIDITNPQEDRYSAVVIAQNTDLSPDEARQVINEVRQQLNANVGFTPSQMRHYIDRLSTLLPGQSQNTPKGPLPSGQSHSFQD